jgi:hypothetical protein
MALVLVVFVVFIVLLVKIQPNAADVLNGQYFFYSVLQRS